MTPRTAAGKIAGRDLPAEKWRAEYDRRVVRAEAEAARDALESRTVADFHAAITRLDVRGCGGTHLMGYGYCQILHHALIDAALDAESEKVK